MFHFPWCRLGGLWIHPPMAALADGRVAPFGNPRIKALWRLPEACRSLMRPSSPPDAKASVVRPYTLSNKVFASFVLLRSDREVRTRSLRKLNHFFCLNEKFLALWRGSLPADLVYELQFSFNFQLPVVKDRCDPERGRSRKQQTLMHRLSAIGPIDFTLGAEAPCLLRKEVIQPLVPQRLPCYDFIPITTHTLGRLMPDFGCRRLS